MNIERAAVKQRNIKYVMVQGYLSHNLFCSCPVTITCTSKPVMESSISKYSSVMFRHFTNILLLAIFFLLYDFDILDGKFKLIII